MRRWQSRRGDGCAPGGMGGCHALNNESNSGSNVRVTTRVRSHFGREWQGVQLLLDDFCKPIQFCSPAAA
jgi:hypothetical protein